MKIYIKRIRGLPSTVTSPKILAYLRDNNLQEVFNGIEASCYCPNEYIYTPRKLRYLVDDLKRLLKSRQTIK